MIRSRRRFAQTTAEYGVLLAVVIGALVAGQVLIRRGLLARQKSGIDALTGPDATFTVGDSTEAVSTSFSSLAQYEPYYLVSEYDTYSENVEQLHVSTTGNLSVEKVSDITARGTGGYQAQTTAANMTDKDDEWE